MGSSWRGYTATVTVTGTFGTLSASTTLSLAVNAAVGPACWQPYSTEGCFGYVLGTKVSFDGNNWLCSNGNCANCSWMTSCAPGGSGCPWGVVRTEEGPCSP